MVVHHPRAVYVRIVAEQMTKVRPGHIVALFWAERSLRAVRKSVAAHGTGAVVSAPPGAAPSNSLPLVGLYLRKRGANCLERSLIKQSWLFAHGRALAVAVGVGKRDGAFIAHAWIPGFDHPSEGADFREITRIPAR